MARQLRWLERRIHNPEVTGSNPVFATRQNPILKSVGFFGIRLPSFGLIELVQTEASERSKIISVLFLFYVHFTLMQNPSTPLSINQAKTAKRFEDIILYIHFLCSSKENEPKGKTPRQQAFPSNFYKQQQIGSEFEAKKHPLGETGKLELACKDWNELSELGQKRRLDLLKNHCKKLTTTLIISPR